MSAVDYENESRTYDDDRGYDREEPSRSPRGDRNGGDSRARSASPDGHSRGDGRLPSDHKDEHSSNTGTNLFVTGIHPKLSEADVTTLFEKYGEVEDCKIMRDPHSGDSRGFGFVKMVTSDQADAARDALQGQVHEGRVLSIEKARRNRPRTPTPGKYYGPPKRDNRGRPRGGGRFDDRRGGGYERRDDYHGGYGRRDDYYAGGGSGGGGGGSGYRGSRYEDRYEDRGGEAYGERRYRDRSDYGRPEGRGGPSREERYPREERYGREERRGGYYGREERGDRGYDQAPPPREGREGYGNGRGYDDRGDDRYSH